MLVEIILIIVLCAIWLGLPSDMSIINNFFGSLMCAALFFYVIKIPFLGFMGGWTWPFTLDPDIQLKASLSSFFVNVVLMGLILLKARYNNVQKKINMEK